MKGKSTGLLTEKQAKILEMVLSSEGKTQAEMSQELGIAQPEFSRLLRRARKNVVKATETVEYMEEIGYSTPEREKGEKKRVPKEKCIEYARQILYTNTSGGEMPIKEVDLRNTLKRNYSLTDSEVSDAVEAVVKKGFALRTGDKKLNLA